MLDLYEMILSTHTDYALLRTHLADTEALQALQRIAVKAAREIEAVAYAVTRKRASIAAISYAPEMALIDAALQALQQPNRSQGQRDEAQAVLRAQRNKLQAASCKRSSQKLASCTAPRSRWRTPARPGKAPTWTLFCRSNSTAPA